MHEMNINGFRKQVLREKKLDVKLYLLAFTNKKLKTQKIFILNNLSFPNYFSQIQSLFRVYLNFILYLKLIISIYYTSLVFCVVSFVK